METPVQITFRNMEASDALRDLIMEKVAKLERFHSHITGCHIIVSSPHRHHHKGKLYHLHINLIVPGEEIVINRESDEEHGHEDVYVAMNDAFDKLKRQLEDYVRRRRGDVKHHEAPGEGL